MPTLGDGANDIVEAADGVADPPTVGSDQENGNESHEEEEEDAGEEPALIYRNAQMLSQQEWDGLISTNKLLHGHQIRGDVPDVVRARRAAFVLKNPDKIPGGVRPSFQVVDGSTIQISQSQTEFQRSLAQNSFSKKSIDTELSAGDMGIQGGFLGGRGHDHTEGENDGQHLQKSEYHATYDFPRARVFLDEYELDICADCNELLKKVEQRKDERSLREFDIKYGHIFVTSVVLGGQQKLTKFAEAIELKTEAQKQDAVRAALGAKIIAPYVSGSFQYSKNRGSDSSRQEDRHVDLAYTGMSASGGDTLNGADVPNWIKTVASPENWRVIGNETVVPMACLLSLVTHKPWIPGLFLWIRKGRPKPLETLKDEIRQRDLDELRKWLIEESGSSKGAQHLRE